MLSFSEDITSIQIELSSICNSLCLGCSRTDPNLNDTRSYIPKTEYLKQEMIIDLLKSKKGQKIKLIEYCGTIDEPLAYPYFLELNEEIARIRPGMKVVVHTNGGLRNPEYFKKLAEVWKKFDPMSCFRFSVDGLKETNEIYRQNVKWDKVIANMKALCETETRVIWQFLIFPWNEHEIPEVQKLAKEIGCTELWIRPDRSVGPVTLKEILDKKAAKIPPQDSRPLGGPEFFEQLKQRFSDEIACSYLNDKQMLFLAYDGRVWPCCFHASVYHGPQVRLDYFEQLVLRSYEKGFNSLLKHSFDEILEHPFFRHELVDSWSSSDPDSRKWKCLQSCGKKNVRVSDGKIDDKKHLAHIRL